MLPQWQPPSQGRLAQLVDASGRIVDLMNENASVDEGLKEGMPCAASVG